mmetsp:Transcript_4479/g.12329  ORF Transcript_4479/g.12329 Transcript_4479/m.12329 type:complete len:213 (-) Transcript_4479:1223-1861(-)
MLDQDSHQRGVGEPYPKVARQAISNIHVACATWRPGHALLRQGTRLQPRPRLGPAQAGPLRGLHLALRLLRQVRVQRGRRRHAAQRPQGGPGDARRGDAHERSPVVLAHGPRLHGDWRGPTLQRDHDLRAGRRRLEGALREIHKRHAPAVGDGGASLAPAHSPSRRGVADLRARPGAGDAGVRAGGAEAARGAVLGEGAAATWECRLTMSSH